MEATFAENNENNLSVETRDLILSAVECRIVRAMVTNMGKIDLDMTLADFLKKIHVAFNGMPISRRIAHLLKFAENTYFSGESSVRGKKQFSIGQLLGAYKHPQLNCFREETIPKKNDFFEIDGKMISVGDGVTDDSLMVLNEILWLAGVIDDLPKRDQEIIKILSSVDTHTSINDFLDLLMTTDLFDNSQLVFLQKVFFPCLREAVAAKSGVFTQFTVLEFYSMFAGKATKSGVNFRECRFKNFPEFKSYIATNFQSSNEQSNLAMGETGDETFKNVISLLRRIFNTLPRYKEGFDLEIEKGRFETAQDVGRHSSPIAS